MQSGNLCRCSLEASGQGNVRRIIIKNDTGHTVIEIEHQPEPRADDDHGTGQ
jgi:hypothetical protein